MAQRPHASRRATSPNSAADLRALLSFGRCCARAASLGDLTKLEQHALQGFGLTVERSTRGLDHRITFVDEIHRPSTAVAVNYDRVIVTTSDTTENRRIESFSTDDPQELAGVHRPISLVATVRATPFGDRASAGA